MDCFRNLPDRGDDLACRLRRSTSLVLLTGFLWTATSTDGNAQIDPSPKGNGNHQELPKALPKARLLEEREAMIALAMKRRAQLMAARDLRILALHHPASFDRLIFPAMQSGKNARRELELRLAAQLETLDRDCQLSEQQKSKLELFGRGDLHRYFSEFETVKADYQLLTPDDPPGQALLEECDRLRSKWRDALSNPESLIQKGIPKILTANQLARHNAANGRRLHERHKSNCELANVWIQNSVSLSDQEEKNLANVLLNQTHSRLEPGEYDIEFLLWQLRRLPKDRLKALVDERKLLPLLTYLSQFEGYEFLLSQHGYLSALEQADRTKLDDQSGTAKKHN